MAGVCVFVCAVVAAASLRLPSGDTPTEDRNGDGRPDVWRVYDRQHRLSEVTIDTNFDGQSDVHEYYRSGGLVRRESDRDFNNHVDLVQEFDASTHEHARSLVDVDFDGSADLLVLFQDGRPIYSKWAKPAASRPVRTEFAGSSLPATHRLDPLRSPFSGDLAVTPLPVVGDADVCVGLPTSVGLPVPWATTACPFDVRAGPSGSCDSIPASPSVAPYSPRGPPTSPPV